MTMKAFIIAAVCIWSGSVLAQEPNYPSRPQGYVSDFAGVISAQDKDLITGLAQGLEEKTTDQMAVVTVKSTQPETIEGYAVELFKRWGIGHKGKDNGILLLVAVQDRKVRIETGYGLEGTLPDVIGNKIIRDMMVPSFKSGQYSAGIKNGVVAIVSVMTGDKSFNIGGPENSSEAPPTVWVFFAIMMIVMFLRMFGRVVGGGRGYWGGGYIGGGGFSGGGGGFGGFGGGMSGGGGASGGW